MSVPLDALRDLLGPGLVLIAIVAWLVRKAWTAARTEGELEREREREAAGAEALRAEPARPHPVAALDGERAGPPDPLSGADTSQARAEHVAAVAALLRAGSPRPPAEVVWVRSLGPHVAWLERGLAGAQALHVARLDGGAVAERWEFR